MTDKQQEKLLESLHPYENGECRQMSELEELRLRELDCIKMIDSIICYGGFGHTAEEILESEKRASHNYLENYIKDLGEAKVLELIKTQLYDIADVVRGVYTDCDGCTYNKIIWREN